MCADLTVLKASQEQVPSLCQDRQKRILQQLLIEDINGIFATGNKCTFSSQISTPINFLARKAVLVIIVDNKRLGCIYKNMKGYSNEQSRTTLTASIYQVFGIFTGGRFAGFFLLAAGQVFFLDYHW